MTTASLWMQDLACVQGSGGASHRLARTHTHKHKHKHKCTPSPERAVNSTSQLWGTLPQALSRGMQVREVGVSDLISGSLVCLVVPTGCLIRFKESTDKCFPSSKGDTRTYAPNTRKLPTHTHTHTHTRTHAHRQTDRQTDSQPARQTHTHTHIVL